MPDGTNNIYLDSTFTSVAEDYISVDSEVEFVDPDNIGNYNIPIIYQTTVSSTTIISSDIEYIGNCITISGINNIPLSFFRELSSDFETIPSLVDYSIDNIVSGTIDNHIIYLTGYNAISGTINEKINFIAGEYYTSFKSYLIEHNCGSVISDSNSYWQLYMNYSGHVNPSGLPIPSLDGYDESIVEYGGEYVSSGAFNPYIDVTFAGWVKFPFVADVFSVDMNISDAHPFDVETISGCVTTIYSDIYSARLTTSGIEVDIYCALTDFAILSAEVETTKGGVGYLTQEIYSTAVGLPRITCDVNLYPLKITNFSLDIGEYTTASDYISVDVLDDVYEITTSGTYFKVDGHIVPVTFSGIEDGYRMFYDPIDDFSSLNGPTIFTACAENSNGNILEKGYYLTYGYLVEYKNYSRMGQDYDYNTLVTVRITAEDYASCPKLSSDGHRFITEQRKNVDLGASIIGMFHADDVSNLSAEIYPVSTAYFYGKVFEVIINAKDFAGNSIEPFVLTYKIEDKPS